MSSPIRVIDPDSPEWPTPLNDLGEAAPSRLWLRGAGDLAELSACAVAVVGSRAATSYGSHVAADLAYGLARHGVTIVSGGGYGIDTAAHRAAVAALTPPQMPACSTRSPEPA